MNRQMRSGGAGFYVLVLAIIGIAMYISSIMTSSTGSQYNVEDFKQDVKAGKVTSVEITPNEETPTGVVRANYENKRSKHFNCTDIKDVEEIIKTDSIDVKKIYVHKIRLGRKLVTSIHRILVSIL